eukprot:6200759-Pleurochrysis_carterae.AAC.1
MGAVLKQTITRDTTNDNILTASRYINNLKEIAKQFNCRYSTAEWSSKQLNKLVNEIVVLYSDHANITERPRVEPTLLTFPLMLPLTLVGEDRVVEARNEVNALVDGVLAADVDFYLAVKLRGGRRPRKWELRAGSYDGQIALGRWGQTAGDNAAADIARGMAGLSDLLHDAHCAAGGGTAAADPSFDMAELAAQ